MLIANLPLWMGSLHKETYSNHHSDGRYVIKPQTTTTLYGLAATACPFHLAIAAHGRFCDRDHFSVELKLPLWSRIFAALSCFISHYRIDHMAHF